MENLKVNTATGKEYFIKAKHVKSFNLNPGEKVAWNGTLDLYKDELGNCYIERHTGNSNHPVVCFRVHSDIQNEKEPKEAMKYLNF